MMLIFCGGMGLEGDFYNRQAINQSIKQTGTHTKATQPSHIHLTKLFNATQHARETERRTHAPLAPHAEDGLGEVQLLP